MKDKTGGQAFPSVIKHHGPDIIEEITGGGMTLLDYFAAKAMNGILSNTIGEVSGEKTADSAYKMASAMIKEREKWME